MRVSGLDGFGLREKEKEKFFRERKSGSLSLSVILVVGSILVKPPSSSFMAAVLVSKGLRRACPMSVGCTRSRNMEQSCRLLFF